MPHSYRVLPCEVSHQLPRTAAITLHGEYLYIISSDVEYHWQSTSAFRYHLPTKACVRLPDLQHSRRRPSVAVVSNPHLHRKDHIRIVVIGSNPNNTCGEILDIKKDTTDMSSLHWSPIVGMSGTRYDTAVVAHNHRVYVFGGTDAVFKESVKSCEMYEPFPPNDTKHTPSTPTITSTVASTLDTSGRWVSLPNCLSARSQSACVVVDNRILILGGERVIDRSSSIQYQCIEEYNPYSNIFRVLRWCLPDSLSQFGCGYDTSTQTLMLATKDGIYTRHSPFELSWWIRSPANISVLPSQPASFC